MAGGRHSADAPAPAGDPRGAGAQRKAAGGQHGAPKPAGKQQRALSWIVVAVLLLGAAAAIIGTLASIGGSGPDLDPKVAGGSVSHGASGGVDAETATNPRSGSSSSSSAPGGSTSTSPGPGGPAVPVFGVDNPVWPAAPYVTAAVVRVTVSSTHPRAGSPVTVTISGVAAGQGIDVAIEGNGQTFALGTLHPDARGATGQAFTVPTPLSGPSTLKVLDTAIGGSSQIALNVIGVNDTSDTGGGQSGSASGSSSASSAGSSGGTSAGSSSGGVDAASVNAVSAGNGASRGIVSGGWGWSQAGVVAVIALIFLLPITGLGLLFLGRRSRPWRRT